MILHSSSQLDQWEDAVLAALAGRRWRMTADIADDTGLPTPAVRLTLRGLRDLGVLDRNIRGEWQIIAAGSFADRRSSEAPQ